MFALACGWASGAVRALLQFGNRDKMELARRDDPDALKFAREAADIAGEHVLCAPDERTLEYHVVGRIMRRFDGCTGGRRKGPASRRLHRQHDPVRIETNAGSGQCFFAFVEKGLGKHRRKSSVQSQIK